MRLVDPTVARRGEFIETFERTRDGFKEMEQVARRMEWVLRAKDADGEIVYTLMAMWGKTARSKTDTWQLYWLPAGVAKIPPAPPAPAKPEPATPVVTAQTRVRCGWCGYLITAAGHRATCEN